LTPHTGPAEALFAPEFFDAMRKALNPGGIICTQAECQWLHLDFIAKVYRCATPLFGPLCYSAGWLWGGDVPPARHLC